MEYHNLANYDSIESFHQESRKERGPPIAFRIMRKYTWTSVKKMKWDLTRTRRVKMSGSSKRFISLPFSGSWPHLLMVSSRISSLSNLAYISAWPRNIFKKKSFTHENVSLSLQPRDRFFKVQRKSAVSTRSVLFEAQWLCPGFLVKITIKRGGSGENLALRTWVNITICISNQMSSF